MEQVNSLPITLKNNPKDVIIQGLKMAFAKFGPLRVPIDFSKDYPTRESWTTASNGNTNVNKRRIVVKKINNTPVLQSIGDSYTGSFDFMDRSAESDLAAMQTGGLGWVDNYTIEISAWTTDADDRDNLVELIKMVMLELTQARTAAGKEPYFLEHGIASVKFVRESDSNSTTKVQNGPMYSGSTTWNLVVPFYNTTRQEFIALKYSLVDNIIKFPGEGSDNNTIVVTPNNPGGGSESIGPLPTDNNNPSNDYPISVPTGQSSITDTLPKDNETIIVDPKNPSTELKGGSSLLDEFLKE